MHEIGFRYADIFKLILADCLIAGADTDIYTHNFFFHLREHKVSRVLTYYSSCDVLLVETDIKHFL